MIKTKCGNREKKYVDFENMLSSKQSLNKKPNHVFLLSPTMDDIPHILSALRIKGRNPSEAVVQEREKTQKRKQNEEKFPATPGAPKTPTRPTTKEVLFVPAIRYFVDLPPANPANPATQPASQPALHEKGSKKQDPRCNPSPRSPQENEDQNQ